MIAALGLRYGTDEATDMAENIQRTLAIEAYRSSVYMAKERGAFEIYDTKREEKIRLSTDCVKQIPVSTKIWLNTDVVTLLV